MTWAHEIQSTTSIPEELDYLAKRVLCNVLVAKTHPNPSNTCPLLDLATSLNKYTCEIVIIPSQVDLKAIEIIIVHLLEFG